MSSKAQEFEANQKRLLSMKKSKLVKIARSMNNDIKKNLIKDVHKIKKDKLIAEMLSRYELLKKHIDSDLTEFEKPKSGDQFVKEYVNNLALKYNMSQVKLDPKTGKFDAKNKEQMNKILKKQVQEIDKQIEKNKKKKN